MYAKILKHLCGLMGVSSTCGEEVVPSEVTMIESKYIEYLKFRVLDITDFEDFTKEQGIYNYRLLGDPEWWKKHMNGKDEKGCEFILVRYLIKGTEAQFETVISPNCRLFIMNDDGKTIDSLRCN